MSSAGIATFSGGFKVLVVSEVCFAVVGCEMCVSSSPNAPGLICVSLGFLDDRSPERKREERVFLIY